VSHSGVLSKLNMQEMKCIKCGREAVGHWATIAHNDEIRDNITRMRQKWEAERGALATVRGDINRVNKRASKLFFGRDNQIYAVSGSSPSPRPDARALVRPIIFRVCIRPLSRVATACVCHLGSYQARLVFPKSFGWRTARVSRAMSKHCRSERCENSIPA
jgi:hypothetical protein